MPERRFRTRLVPHDAVDGDVREQIVRRQDEPKYDELEHEEAHNQRTRAEHQVLDELLHSGTHGD
jgi:hypothetical protein